MSFVKSKMQEKAECFFCHRPDGLERHHALHGRGIRQLAEADGLWVWLCFKHHRLLHDKNEGDRELQRLAQETYLKDHSREEFLRRYGRYYDC